ncbi:MAG: FHA domain-containing protein [Anaerolineae bacterium]|nr:FHA domain-containing protein [Anaerolineae bacterium]
MDILWNALLFSGKWLFIGLIYAMLFLVLLAVRREMQGHLADPASTTTPPKGRLKVLNSGSDKRTRPGTLLNLSKETSLGADAANNLVLADQYISGQHARLRWDGTQWRLRDLGSTNGTFVNQRRLTPQQEEPVPFGATVGLGDMTFELTE